MSKYHVSKKAPLVSVCLPVFNGASTIRRALDSLVDQIWPNIEIINCDDVSADNIPKICGKYARKYSFVRFEQNKENLGLGGVLSFKKIYPWPKINIAPRLPKMIYGIKVLLKN